MLYSNKSFRGLLGLALLILAIACAIIVFGCSSSKHIDTTNHTTEEKKEINIDSLVKSSEEKIRKQYEEKQKETSAAIEFMKNNDEVMEDVINELQNTLYANGMSADSITDILNRLRSTPCNGGKVKVNTDGSYEISGIKSLNAKVFELQKKLDSTIQRKSDSTVLHKTDTEAKKEVVKIKSVDKEVKLMSWLMFFIVGYVLGVFLPPMKIMDVVKKLITKI